MLGQQEPSTCKDPEVGGTPLGTGSGSWWLTQIKPTRSERMGAKAGKKGPVYEELQSIDDGSGFS